MQKSDRKKKYNGIQSNKPAKMHLVNLDEDVNISVYNEDLRMELSGMIHGKPIGAQSTKPNGNAPNRGHS